MGLKLEQIISATGLAKTGGPDTAGIEISGIYASDLLSDVLGRANPNDVWITLQTHKNVVAVASLKGIRAIINVNGNKPDADTLELAMQEGIVMLSTTKSTFSLCGEIYKTMDAYAMV